MRARAALVGALLVSCGVGAPSPATPTVHFLGKVKLLEEQGQVYPLFDQGNAPRLLLEPRRPAEGECDPFSGGALALELTPPSGAPLHHSLALPSPQLSPVEGGWLLPLAELPSWGDALKGLTPGRQGLTLAWRCTAEGEPSLTSHPFFIHLPFDKDPATAALREELARVEAAPPEAQVAGLEELISRTPSPTLGAVLTMKQVQLLRARGDHQAMEAAAARAEELARQAHLPSEEIRAISAAHEAAREQGELERATRHLERALKRDQALGYLARLHLEHYALSVLLERQGQRLGALDEAEQALAFARRTGNKRFSIGMELWVLDLLLGLGHVSAVRERLEALRPPPSVADDIDADLLTNMGWVLLRAGAGEAPERRAERLERAESYFRAALEAARAAADPLEEANSLANLAEVSRQRGDIPTVQALLDQARARYPEGDPGLAAMLELLEIDLLLRGGGAAQARERAERMEAQARARAEMPFVSAAAFAAGRAWEQAGDLAQAQVAYDRAYLALVNDPAAASPLHRAFLLGSSSEVEAARLSVRLARGQREEALAVAEQQLWVRRSGGGPRAQGGELPEEQRARHRALLQQVDQQLARLSTLPETPARLEQRRGLEALRQRSWADLMMSSARADGSPPPLELAPLLSSLSQGEVILRMALLPTELVVWELRREGLQTRRIRAQGEELKRQIATFAQGCRRGSPDAALGELLATRLLGGLRASPPTRLQIAGDGVWRELPWGALPVASGVSLLEASIVSFRPSLLVAAGELPRSERPLIVADPTRDLSAAAREGREIAAALPGARLLLHEQATREVVTEALPRASLLHYAGHGATDPHRPWLSHLRLAQAQRLSLMDVGELSLTASLVFLNACEGAQTSSDGGGALSLADGFALAGAREVISSRWDLPDDGAVAVARAFYRHRAAHQGDTARALTLALREVQASPEGRSSTVWSAYLLLGTPPARNTQ